MIRIITDSGRIFLYEELVQLNYNSPDTDDENNAQDSGSWEINGTLAPGQEGAPNNDMYPLSGPLSIRTIEFLP